MKGLNNTSHAFSIIEVLVGIFIFSLGLISIYAVIDSTFKLNDYNKNYIIATNLAREQSELMRNIRDTNYQKFKKYNQKNPQATYRDSGSLFATGTYYTIENDYRSFDAPISVSEIPSFHEGENNLNNMKSYRLCRDTIGRYVYCEGTSFPTTPFYRYLYVDEVESQGEVIDEALKIKSKVIWYMRGYHEFEVDMILADWRRL